MVLSRTAHSSGENIPTINKAEEEGFAVNIIRTTLEGSNSFLPFFVTSPVQLNAQQKICFNLKIS